MSTHARDAIRHATWRCNRCGAAFVVSKPLWFGHANTSCPVCGSPDTAFVSDSVEIREKEEHE